MSKDKKPSNFNSIEFQLLAAVITFSIISWPFLTRLELGLGEFFSYAYICWVLAPLLVFWLSKGSDS